MTESEAELTPCIQLSTARSPPQPPQPAEPAEPAAIAKMTQTACTPSACSELVSRAEALVKAHMAQYDPSHDWAHVERVRRIAMKIAGTLGPGLDMLVVELAALFHDMAAKYTTTSSLPTLLEPFFTHPLISSVLSQSQISLINRIIPSVSWTAEARLRAADDWGTWHDTCLELHAVQDADRVDAIGAVGVMRCAAFSGVRGRKLVEDKQGGGSAEAHFEEKLMRIRERMKTDYGKCEAEKRHQTMVDFLAALERERGMWSES